MKFDFCVMNPPYGTMHLKFLEASIGLSDFVVSIQPYRWLTDIIRWYDKGSDFTKYKAIVDKIYDIEFLNESDAWRIFTIHFYKLGIYTCTPEGGFDYKAFFGNDIFEKTRAHLKTNILPYDIDKIDGWRVYLPKIMSMNDYKFVLSGHLARRFRVYYDGKKDGRNWYDFYQHNGSTHTGPMPCSIPFDSEKEAENFVETQKTGFVKYIENLTLTDMNLKPWKLLWMGGCKNPRTGEIGYNSSWIDEDFEEYFKLTDNDIVTYRQFLENKRNEYEIWQKQRELLKMQAKQEKLRETQENKGKQDKNTRNTLNV